VTSPDPERPAQLTETDITLVTRGITVQGAVVLSNALALVVQPTAESHARAVGGKPGDPVELFWRTGFEERMLPAEITSVEDGSPVRWHLRATGESRPSTRRRAVRAVVELPVRIRTGTSEVRGDTLDLSEGGVRTLVDGWGLAPEPGTPVQVDVEVGPADADPVRVLHGVVVRQEERAGRWVLSIRFDALPERDEDRLRRRVFQALREERARAVD
jgi:hypothetical protein